MSREDAALALGRFGLGARPGDIDRIAADPRAAILAELEASNPATLADPALPNAVDSFAAIRRDQMARVAARRAAKNGTTAAAVIPPAVGAFPGMASPGTAATPAMPAMAAALAPPRAAEGLYRQEIAARIDRNLRVEIGFVERLVAFWSNHFAVQADKEESIRGLAGVFEREAIRPHVLGRFGDMLLAATRHPAMLLSLDNAESVGPNSPAGLKTGRGLNENHAREILELHTIGVDAGYHQADVTEFARILTGWTFVRDIEKPGFGVFGFQPQRHEPGDRRLMGVTYRADPKHPAANESQGVKALADLAAHPATAKHIARKLARHFVDDNPPPALVATLARTFRRSGGDLKAVSIALVTSDLAWKDGRKFATPQQFVGSAMRVSGVSMEPQRLLGLLRALGQTPWGPTSPEGFHDDAASWLSPEGMTTRLDVADRIAQQAALDRPPAQIAEDVFGPKLSAETRQSVQRAESGRQALALLLMSPEFQWR